MGAVIRRIFQVGWLLGVLVLVALAVPASAAQRQPKKSPHGNLNIPCENCHTATSWAPIRAIPEFNHDTTRYPLRGMHEKVACTGCHVKPVFTDVGKDCANCHADFHRGQFGANCAQCHTVNGWQVSVQQISQHFNRFPLLGMHAVVQCDECHKNAAQGNYLGLSTACDSCHMSDFNSTTNPPHTADLTDFAPSNCQSCHTSFDTWQGATFNGNHAAPPINFPLTAGHAGVACASCHIGNNYHLQILASDCGNSQCHLTTWQQTTNPVHPSAGPAFAVTQCATCHNTASWTTAIFDHSTTGFLLTNGHANLACTQCHINNNYNLTITSTDCGNSQCHLTTWQQTTNPVHPTAGSAFAVTQCATCHNTVSWTTAIFDHSTTGFLLTQGHANLQCAQCHINNNYSLTITATQCGNSQCHLTDWTNTNNPTHSTAGAEFAASNCSTCHTPAGWTGASFDHSVTGFLLTQGHANLQCAQCHINNNYALTITATQCGNAQCHLTDWNNTNNPVHSTSGAAFAASNCSTCHTPAGWTGAAFDHSTTGFTLVGTHMSPTPTPCASCHINNNYTLNSADCYGCHSAAYQSTTTLGGTVPNHVTANFPITASACAACHPITTWSAGTFDHTSFGFPLTQGHASLQCTQCHINGNYALQIAATDCGNSQCHLTDWTNTNNPTHSAAGAAFAASQCSTCHTPASWTTSTFNHNLTTFPLTGAHATTVTCAQCHVNNNYAGTLPTTCWGCHQTDYNSTANLGGTIPNHVTSNFPQDCTLCHTTTNWTSSTFNHNSTSFPLTGLHVSVACSLCHVNNNYAGTLPTTCDGAGCHLTDWQNTNAPPHQTVSVAFPAFASANCTNCHTTAAAFTTTSWDHGTTGFTLTGAHTTTACALCHVGNNYALPASTCWTCHQTDYNSTANLGGAIPNHVSASFPQDCTICHTTTNWTGAIFNHNTTAFPLTGFHTGVACASCHTTANGGYGPNVPTLCSGCHMADYNSTVTISQTNSSVPNHVSLSYPTTCDSCHTTTSWLGATFNHNSTGFPLTGAHVTVACNLCHLTSAPPPTDCYSCHTADWNSTASLGGTVPNHAAAALISSSGFSTSACSTCHNTTAWTGVTFTHPSQFPTSHGNAGGVCSMCHTNANDYTVFQCTGCHGNNNSANFQHPSVGGYVYASPNCYACHPRGSGG